MSAYGCLEWVNRVQKNKKNEMNKRKNEQEEK